jgi:transcriptional regulator with XRE-family HTH domain
MKLKDQLANLIKKYDVSSSHLSRETGIPSSTLSDWLAGSSPKNLEQLKKLANYFKVSIDYLCFGESHISEFEQYKNEINAGVYEVILRRVKK